jgi:putative membrane protein
MTGWDRLDRRTIAVTALFMAGTAVVAGVPSALGIARGTGSMATALTWVLPGAALLIVIGVVADWLRWRSTRYRIGPERVEVHSGVLWRRRRSLQRDRIRTVDLAADPLLRVFGLVAVRIGTGEHAGDGTVSLRPLTRETADELRRTLLDRAGDPGRDGLLAELDPRWIRYAPLSFVAPALGAAAFGGALNVADWFGLQEGLVGLVIELFRDVPLLAVIAILFAAGLVIGTVGALALWVEMWWGHRLEREPTGTLRVRRGLLTTRSISIEEARLRGVDLVEPLGTRLAGAARVDAVVTGMATGAEAQKTQNNTLLPAAPRAIADRVAADVLREPVPPTGTPLTGHPLAARGRRLRWALAAVAAAELPLIILGALLTDVLLHIAWISALVAVPVAVALALDAYRNLGHREVGEYLVVRSGTVRRSTVALQRRGIIGWTVRQSVFQRRAGLATVLATTAAGAGAYAIRDVGTGTGLDVADAAVPDLLAPFLERPDSAEGREPAVSAAGGR